jgi:uroporphyrin-III C-methyltransferase
MDGKVFLVGAGPGDPELLTIKEIRILQAADVVLHDDLISPQILEFAPKSAHLRSVGKRCGRKSIQQQEINALMVAFASFGLKVVRLKGGDPLLFGRAGEEIDALRAANVAFEIVPGVTSASASAAALDISLTHRDKASAVVFLTSHQAPGNSASEWQTYVRSGATLAIYMPGFDYAQTAARLLSAGIGQETPCAIISQASRPKQQIYRTTIRNLSGAPKLPAPTLLLVGDVVQSANANVSRDQRVVDTRLPFEIVPATVLEVFADNQVFWGD